MRTHTRITLALAAAAWVCLMAWALGFDFNERGSTAANTLLCSTAAAAAVLIVTHPFSDS